MTNQEIAQLINERIGSEPVPFESVRALAIQIYELLGGTEDDENFEDIYEILLAIVPIAHPGGSQIDDNNVSTGTTWSSSKIYSELEGYAKTNDLSIYATKNDISTFITDNDVSIYATKTYVDSSLANKANKIDASIFLDLTNQLVDYTNINSITTPGEYVISLDATYMLQTLSGFGIGTLSVMKDIYGTIMQTIHIDILGASYLITRYSANNGNTWVENVTIDDNVLTAYIDDSDKSKDKVPCTYSSDKINQLLALYATKASVNSSLANKADKSYVDTNFAKLSVLTQSAYDALVSGGTVDSSTLYIISDAQ